MEDGRIDFEAADPNVVFIIGTDTSFNKRFINLAAGRFEITALDTFTTCFITLDTVILAPDTLKLDTFSMTANCGMNDGVAAVIPSGGTAPYTYLWDIAAGTDTIRNQGPGTYTVVVTDDLGCVATQSVTIAADDTPVQMGMDISCAEVTSNSITYSWVPVTGVVLYEVQVGDQPWSAPSATTTLLVPNLNILESVKIRIRGTADCISVLDSMTCMTTDCTPPTGEFDIVRAGRCADYTDGVLSFASASPNIVYIMDGDTTDIGVYEDMPPGRYTVELLDTITLCNSLTDTVLFNPAPLVLETFTQSENCGEQDGVVAVTPTGGVAPYEIFWDIGSTADTVRDLTAEIYPVTVIDDRGCIANTSLEIGLNIDNLQDLRLDVKCPSVTNNSIKFTWDQVADITNYEVNVNGTGWDFPSSDFFEHELTNLGFSEIFEVQVRGNSDCGGSVVGNKICATRTCIPPTVTIGTPKNVSCVGSLDGGLDVIVNTFPFSFVDTTFFRVIDSAGICVIDFDQITVDTLTAPIGGFVIIGSDTIEATEANPMVSFAGLAPGTYTVNLMDTSLTCRSTIEYTIEEPDSLGIITNFEGPVTCTNANDGILVAFGLGGTLPYSYDWNEGEFEEEVYSDLAPGTYDLVLSDANGCTAEESYVVAEPDSLIADVFVQNIGCGETNTGVAAIVSNSTVGYEVSWTTGEMTDTIANLAPGTYEAVVINENDCVDNVQVTIDAVDLILNTTTTMPLCGNVNMETAFITASAVVTASGNEEGRYSYEWNDPLSQITDTASMLAPGQYIVTVTDLTANCVKTDTININAPPPLVANILNTDNETCPGTSDGSIIFNIEGGTPGYEIDWGDEFVRTTPGRNDLSAGSYLITITDDNGCDQELEFRINAPDSIKLAFETEEITCSSDRGTATVIATGGSGDFSYQWNDLAQQTTATAIDLSEAEFDVIVTDNMTGCATNAGIAIVQATPLMLTTTSTPSLCRGKPTGTAMVEVNGGSGNYQYLWDDEMAQETQMADSLNPGDYMVLVLDDTGCEDSVLITVEDSSVPIEIEFRKEDISCAGETDGMSEVEVSGGAPQYAYEWSTGATSRMINNLDEGTYMLTVTDQNGCTNTDTVAIVMPEALAGTFIENSISCTGERDGQITVQATGGTGVYQYSIDGNRFTSEAVFPNLRENNYEVFVRDSMGCMVGLGIAPILDPEEIEVLVDAQLILEADKINTLDALVMNGQGELSYEWTSDKEPASLLCDDCPNPEIKPQFGQTYSVVVTDTSGCEATSSVQVLVRQERGVFVPTGFSPNSDGLNDMLMVHGKEGTRVLDFKIFDRWGELVYENGDFMVNDIEGAWDGTYRGQVLNSAVFTWYAEVEFADGLQDIVKGHTTLIR